jgi:drug/metabolite transporter (DMT)-like permease
MILILLLYFLIATTFIFGKLLLGFVPPIFLIAIRMIISGLLLLFFYLFTREKTSCKQKKDYLFLLGTAIFHVLIPFTTEYIAMQTIDPSAVCLFYNISPFFSAILSYLFFEEKMTKKKWTGLGIGILGIFYFTAPSFFLNPLAILSARPAFAHILMLISVMTSCFGWILVRILVKDRNFSPLFVNGISMLIGGVFALPLSYFFEGRFDILKIEDKAYFIFLLALLIFLANVVFYNFYSFLLTKYTATILSFFGLFTPLFVVFLQNVFLDIPIAPAFFESTLIISFGIYIFYQEELKQGYIS